MKIRVFLERRSMVSSPYDYWNYEVLDDENKIIASEYSRWGTQRETIRAAKRARRLAGKGIFLGRN